MSISGKEIILKCQFKMIEIKLSQGAKPGHGGVLPKAKITDEIAQIRQLPKMSLLSSTLVSR